MKKIIFELAVFFIAVSAFAIGVNVESSEKMYAFLISFIAGIVWIILHSCNNALKIPDNMDV
ncbi:MAG: hypothetical protein E7005_01255 [Alphaproteobacteria bacterium]|nr:hypothetical protein [Alphaproteobacteria bacterium]